MHGLKAIDPLYIGKYNVLKSFFFPDLGEQTNRKENNEL